jgi:hypothetical protein
MLVVSLYWLFFWFGLFGISISSSEYPSDWDYSLSWQSVQPSQRFWNFLGLPHVICKIIVRCIVGTFDYWLSDVWARARSVWMVVRLANSLLNLGSLVNGLICNLVTAISLAMNGFISRTEAEPTNYCSLVFFLNPKMYNFLLSISDSLPVYLWFFQRAHAIHINPLVEFWMLQKLWVFINHWD